MRRRQTRSGGSCVLSQPDAPRLCCFAQTSVVQTCTITKRKNHQLTTTAATAGATLNKLHYPDQTIKKRYSSVFRTGKHLHVKISFVYREHRTANMF